MASQNYQEDDLEDINPIPLFPTTQKTNGGANDGDLGKIVYNQSFNPQQQYMESQSNNQQGLVHPNNLLCSLPNSSGFDTSDMALPPMNIQGNIKQLPVPPLQHPETRIVPGDYDVISGRSSTAFNNIGNRRFRYYIARSLPGYLKATSRNQKSRVIWETAQRFQDETKARFLKQKAGGTFVLLNKKEVRSKVGHALRDMAAHKRASFPDQAPARECPTSPPRRAASPRSGGQAKVQNDNH